LPEGYENDLSDIQFKPDFIGLNYYFSNRMRHADNWVGAEPIEEPDVAKTAMDWPIRPEGIHWLLKRAHEAYDLPSIYITENGAAFDDVTDGVVVDDPDRVAYLDSHIRQVLKARDEGVPVDGYFVWSLLDNFEWAFGYDKRFGIIRVDYETQERIVKSSGHWYSHLAKAAAGL
jgi:beta-glucosidase